MSKRTIYFLNLAAVLASVSLSGCTQAPESAVGNAANFNQAPAANRAAASPFPANNLPAPVSNTSGAPVKGKAPSNQPTPQIGSGGDDFSLFTQVRGQLATDTELSTAVIVEVKEGAVTLNGNVSSQAQRSKAEQIVQGVKGIKSLKNNLRVKS